MQINRQKNEYLTGESEKGKEERGKWKASEWIYVKIYLKRGVALVL